jgi:hypothetical protein
MPSDPRPVPLAPSPAIVSTLNEEGQEIRKLADSGIWSAIERATAQLPADKRMAVVAYTDGADVRLGVVARLGKDMSFVGTLTHGLSSGKGLAGEAAIVWTPF